MMQTNENPYASPQEVSAIATTPLTLRQVVKRRLFQPGLVTLLSGMGMPFYQAWVLYRQFTSRPREMYHLDWVIADLRSSVIWAALTVMGSFFCIFGGVQLLKVRGYRICIAASVAMTIPLTSPCSYLGFVVGGWTLIALLQKDTRAAFAEVN